MPLATADQHALAINHHRESLLRAAGVIGTTAVLAAAPAELKQGRGGSFLHLAGIQLNRGI